MNKCLYCGKEIAEKHDNYRHLKCIKNFFGTNKIPSELLSFDEINESIVKELVNKKSVTGVQEKLSYSYKLTNNSKKNVTDAYYIIKPETNNYPLIARLEYVVMNLARIAKIDVPDFGLIKVDSEKFAYIIKRIDRVSNQKIHLEDFCQLANSLTENKYLGSYERCAKIIEKYSDYPQIDLHNFYFRILFCCVTLNSDMHLKNFSLIESDEIKLAPAYDLLPVKLVIDDKYDLALSLNGKRRNLKRDDFIKFANNIGINDKLANGLIKKLLNLEFTFTNYINESILDDDTKVKFVKMMKQKFNNLKEEIR